MSRYEARSSGLVAGSPARVYAVIADYRQHHPRIVPPPYSAVADSDPIPMGTGIRDRPDPGG
jgi:hypothetical protein